jgi:very-short-patch-repair endonuclease
MKKPPEQISRAKSLRKEMSAAERKFWYAINFDKLGRKFRRQQPIGRYFVDFVCFDQKLIVELDGKQHATDEAKKYDNERTDYLESCGYKLLRIPNDDIYKNLNGVVDHLQRILNGEINANDYFKSKYDKNT